jgi:hypothetical protein
VNSTRFNSASQTPTNQQQIYQRPSNYNIANHPSWPPLTPSSWDLPIPPSKPEYRVQGGPGTDIMHRVDAIKAFNEIEVDLKKMLQHLRHDTTKHEPAYFAAVHNLSDKQLTNFSGMHGFRDIFPSFFSNIKYAPPTMSAKLCVQSS